MSQVLLDWVVLE